LHRLAHWFKAHGVPVLGPLVARCNQFLTGVDIAPAAQIGPGLVISHATGIVIGAWAKIGRDAIILHEVTIGSRDPTRREAMPTIGDGVTIGAGAKLIGDITIGDEAFIGVNAIVTKDVPAGSLVVATGGIEITPPRSAQLA